MCVGNEEKNEERERKQKSLLARDINVAELVYSSSLVNMMMIMMMFLLLFLIYLFIFAFFILFCSLDMSHTVSLSLPNIIQPPPPWPP